MVLSTEQLDSIVLAMKIVSPISFVSSAILMVLFLSIKKLQNVQNRIFYNTSWANLFASTIWFFSKYGAVAGDDSILCQGLATGMFYFGLTDVFWLLCMTLNVYFVVIKKWELDELKKVSKWYHLLAWGAPALFIFPLPFISTPEKGRVLANRYIWCSISPKYPEIFLAVFYIPAWMIVDILDLKGSQVASKFSKKLYSFLFVTGLYLLQYFFLWFWPTVNRVLQEVYPDFSNYFLLLMNGVAPASRGFFYLTIFCYGNRDAIASALPKSFFDITNIRSPKPARSSARRKHQFADLSSKLRQHRNITNAFSAAARTFPNCVHPSLNWYRMKNDLNEITRSRAVGGW